MLTTQNTRVFRDAIHGEIRLDLDDRVDALIMRLIDSRELQRLRRVKQLGTTWLTYHSAEHSRFSHSIGTMYVAKQICEQLESSSLAFHASVALAESRVAVLCAALLHDIGHGPFSHSCEEIIGINHESWTYKLILSSDSQVNEILKEFDCNLPEQIVSILKGEYKYKFVSSIVSSELDADRLDYLLRDSYHTGASYGNYDLSSVIESLELDYKNDMILVTGDKGLYAVERYLHAGHSIYQQVCYHKKSLATDTLLKNIFLRARELLKDTKQIFFIDHTMYKWIMKANELNVKEFLMIDDVYVMYHIKLWQDEFDGTLSDLCRRFINRELFKSYEVTSETINSKHYNLMINLALQGLDFNYYIAEVTLPSSPKRFYNPLNPNPLKSIFYKDKNNCVMEISKASKIIKSLASDGTNKTFLISL